MKKTILLNFLILQCVIIGCAQNNTNYEHMIKMNDLTKKNLTVQKGQKMYFQAEVHGSVGMDARYFISDEKKIRLLKEDFLFNNPQQEKMPGGDAAVRTYIFEAVQSGKVEIKIEQVFRGTVEKSDVFKIKVE